MKIMRLYLMAFLLLPLIGCYMAYFSADAIEGYAITSDIVIKYTIHTSIIIFFAFLFTRKGIQLESLDNRISLSKAKKTLTRINIILFLILLIIIYIAGIPVFVHGVNRGVVRANLGLFGPFYSFFVKYLIAASIILVGFIYSFIREKKEIKNKVLLSFFLVFLCALGTGYKSPVVTLLIPGVSFLLYRTSIFKFIPYAFLGLLFLIFTTMMVRRIPFDLAWIFLKHRVFYLTNAGTIGVYYELGDMASWDEMSFQFMSIFGKKITTFVTGIPEHSVEMTKLKLSTYISYLIYPNTQGVLNGEVNLTVSNFGEAVFFFGKRFYFIYSIFSGLFIGNLLRSINKNIDKGNILKVVLFSTFFFSAIIPWINSSNFFGLFGLPTLVYFSLVYWIIKWVLGRIKIIIRK